MEVITGEYKAFWRLEYWMWFFPHPDYDPVNNGRVHLFWKFYWRTCKTGEIIIL